MKILTKLKSWDLFKSRFENLSKFKNLVKVWNAGTIEKPNFLTFNFRIVFTRLK